MSAACAPPVVTGEEAAVLTLVVGEQRCGVAVRAVRDVLGPQALTRIPLAPPEVAGSLNLRGRIVTAIDLRRRLDLPESASAGDRMSIVVEQGGELYSLLADDIGDVVSLPPEALLPNPPTLDPAWLALSSGVYRRDQTLILLLDVRRVLELS